MKQRTPLVKHIFTADPSAHVFDDKIYIYPSHDIPHDGEDDDEGGEYRMEDYHVLSLENLEADCVDNGEALHMKDVPWVSMQMWAPDVAYKEGKYYLYFPAKDKEGIFRVGVAVSSSPIGPFKAEESYIEGSKSIDPAVFEDEDGRYYMYNGLYYLSYSTGTTHYVVYATGTDPMGPFTYRGRILEPVLGWTTHHSIIEYHGKWYLFYHDCELSNGINHRRNVKYVELEYNADGTIKTIIP